MGNTNYKKVKQAICDLLEQGSILNKIVDTHNIFINCEFTVIEEVYLVINEMETKGLIEKIKYNNKHIFTVKVTDKFQCSKI